MCVSWRCQTNRKNNKSDDSITIASLTSVCYAKPLIARLFSRFPAATPISDFAFCRSSDLSIHVRRIFPRTNALLQPSLGAMTALPMTGFHRAQISLHGKQYFRNTATFGILPSPLHSMIHRLQTERRDSFRVRDSHTIPLFSEQECVSDCSGRAFATKAMVCNFYQCAVVSCESSFAKLAFFGKRCIRSFRCFLRKQGQLHLQSVSAIQPSLTLAFIVNLCI